MINRLIQLYALIITLLLFTNQVLANTDFGQDLSPILQKKLSATTYKKENLTIAKIALTNKSTKKSGKLVHGGLTLIVTSINNSKISLKNLSGYTEDRLPYLFIPNPNPLLPKKTLKNIALQFNNPGGKKFKFTYKIYGSITAPKINSISQSNAASGSKMTIIGQNFTRASQIQMAGQSIQPTYLSHQQLEITVPFSINTQLQITPLAAGTYPVSVDGSSPYNFTVTNLPDNPNPPGQVFSEQISTIFQQLAQIQPEFQSVLPELLAQTANEPNTQKFIQGLADVANYLNNQGQTDVLELMKQIDPTSLDTFEKLLLVNESALANIQKQTKLAKTKAVFGIQANITPQQLSGDQWLENRQAFVNEVTFGSPIQFINQVNSISGYCLLVGKINPYVVLPCLSMLTASTILQINAEISVARDERYGIIKRTQLHISNFTGTTDNRACTDKDTPSSVSGLTDKVKRIDTVCQKGILKELEQLNLHLNNADNSEDVASSRAKNITGATLFISNRPDWFQIYNSILSLAGQASGFHFPEPTTPVKLIIDIIIGKLNDLALIKIDNELSQPTSTKEISTKYISSKLSDETLSFANTFSENCEIHDSANRFSTFLKTLADKYFVIPDVFNSFPYGERPSIGACDFKIADEVKMPSEDSVYSQINFHLKNYPRLNLEIQGDGSVSFLFKTVSGVTKCEQSVCTEFLDPGKSSFFWLSAVPPNGVSTQVKWLKNNVEECNKPDCRINLNSGIINDPPYNILVTLNDAPIAVDDTATTGINTPIDIDIKANDYDPDSTPVDQLSIVNLSVEGEASKGTVEINSDGKLKFTPTNGFTGNVVIKYQLIDPQGAKSNESKVDITVSSVHWEGSFNITDCTPLPEGVAQWIWQNPCYAYFPVPGYKGKFYFDDYSTNVILESGLQKNNGVRIVATLGWSSGMSTFAHSISTTYTQNVLSIKLNEEGNGYSFAQVNATGTLSYVFTVVNRTSTSVSGTFNVTMTSGYFDFPVYFVEYWKTLQTTASGTWSAYIKSGSKPSTQMRGYDFCFSNGYAARQATIEECGGQGMTAPSWCSQILDPNACQYD